jgi:hypothetical protein
MLLKALWFKDMPSPARNARFSLYSVTFMSDYGILVKKPYKGWKYFL